MNVLKIGGLEIQAIGALELEQTYEALGGSTILRTMSGYGIKQATWQRLRTVISGGGWLPPGLSAIDTTSQQQVACIVPRAVTADGSRQATLPAARRADTGYTPWALALLPSGEPQRTAVSLAGDVATASAVTGAIAYQVLYYPLLTCWITLTESGNRATADYRWEVVAEEV